MAHDCKLYLTSKISVLEKFGLNSHHLLIANTLSTFKLSSHCTLSFNSYSPGPIITVKIQEPQRPIVHVLYVHWSISDQEIWNKQDLQEDYSQSYTHQNSV